MGIKFREIRATLSESMDTIIKIETRAELIRYLEKAYHFKIEDNELLVRRYGYDYRNGWENYLVSVHGFGPVGFTDGPMV